MENERRISKNEKRRSFYISKISDDKGNVTEVSNSYDTKGNLIQRTEETKFSDQREGNLKKTYNVYDSKGNLIHQTEKTIFPDRMEIIDFFCGKDNVLFKSVIPNIDNVDDVHTEYKEVNGKPVSLETIFNGEYKKEEYREDGSLIRETIRNVDSSGKISLFVVKEYNEKGEII